MKRESKYAIYNYEESDKDLVEILDFYVSQNAEDIYNFFDSFLEKSKCLITIVSTKDKFDLLVKEKRKTSQDIPKWMVGITDDKEIIYLSLYDYKNTTHASALNNYDLALIEYRKTILHEYIHFVNYLYCKKKNYPSPLKCLMEGIALVLSNQKDNIKKEFNYSIDEILNSNNCYDGWYLLVKYFLDNYTKEYFLKLFSDIEYAEKEIKRNYVNIVSYYKNS